MTLLKIKITQFFLLFSFEHKYHRWLVCYMIGTMYHTIASFLSVLIYDFFVLLCKKLFKLPNKIWSFTIISVLVNYEQDFNFLCQKSVNTYLHKFTPLCIRRISFVTMALRCLSTAKKKKKQTVKCNSSAAIRRISLRY